MAATPTDRALWELKNERNKANVRWLLIIVIGSYLAYLLQSGKAREIGGSEIFNWQYIGAVTAGMVLVNVLLVIYLWFVKYRGVTMFALIKYVTMFLDLVAVSLVLVPTDGNHSMFFVVYFVVVVSNGFRYGMRLSLFGVLSFNLLYVGVLAYQYPSLVLPPEESIQREILKVSGVWLVGIYVGYLARRFEILQGEVEKYQELVRRLMARKES